MNDSLFSGRLLLGQLVAITPWLVTLRLRTHWQDPSLSVDLAVGLVWHIYQSYTVFKLNPLYLFLQVLLGVPIWLWIRRDVAETSTSALVKDTGKMSCAQKQPWTKPLILPCRTTHSRMFPKKHSFSYSYLFVGIPAGWSGCAGSLLSADGANKRGWFHVDPADFLARGDGHLGLRGKLDMYLESQDVNPADFPFAYLVTAPQFCGYSFNPVSFWYLYTAQKQLKAMILEVNNTFDERRMYFLKAAATVDDEKDQLQDAGDEDALDDDEATRTIFTNQWKKDFHVSPFNSRDGSYKLIAHDPTPFNTSSALNVNNTILLLSSQNHKKLVARVFSTDQAVDPTEVTVLQKAALIMRWGWIGFVTFPRIIREARKLYFKKSLIVFFRPEVSEGSISRHATQSEKLIERFFFEYLQHVVKNTPHSIAVTYRPAPGTGTHSKAVIRSPSAGDQAGLECDFDVLSPAFYSRFVHYAHTLEALDREFLCTDMKNRTISITKADALAKLFTPNRSASQTTQGSIPARDERLTRALWKLLQWLRCEAAEQAYPTATVDGKYQNMTAKDIRRLPLSELDGFVLRHSGQAYVYRRQVTALFLAQRYAFGFVGIVSCAEVAMKLALLACVEIIWSTYRSNMKMQAPNDLGDIWSAAIFGLALRGSSLLHLLSLLKGFERGYMVPG